MNLRKKRRVILALEPLEDRWLPSTNEFLNGTLSISRPLGNLTLTQTAQNTFTVADSGSSAGHTTFADVADIVISSGSGNHNTTIALGGLVYDGSLVINELQGESSVDHDSVSINNGVIQGQTTIDTGTGNNTVDLASTASVAFNGDLQLVDTPGVLSVSLAATPMRVGGSLSIIEAATIAQGASSLTVGGSTSIQNNILTGNSSITLGGSAFSTGSLHITGSPNANLLTLTNTTVGTSGPGATSIALGNGNASFTTTGTNTFNGSFSYSEGAGTDSVSISAGSTFNASASFNMGSGNDTLGMAGTVHGQLTITSQTSYPSSTQPAASSTLTSVPTATDPVAPSPPSAIAPVLPSPLQLFLDGFTLAIDLFNPGGLSLATADAALMHDLDAAGGGFFNPYLDAGLLAALSSLHNSPNS
jgi:hypothetical protein